MKTGFLLVVGMFLLPHKCSCRHNHLDYNNESRERNESSALRQLVQRAQSIARVRVLRWSSSKANRTKVQVLCTLKGYVSEQILRVAGYHEVRDTTFVGQKFGQTNETLIFIRRSQKHPNIWLLERNGLKEVQQEIKVRKILGFSSTFCQEDRLIETEPKSHVNSRRSKKSVSRCSTQHLSGDTSWYVPLTDTIRRHRRCGAVLVHREWAATSSRCVHRYRNRPARLAVTLGEKAISNISRINSIILHPTWNQPGGRDLALVHLLTPLQQGKPICLAKDAVGNKHAEEVYHNIVASITRFDRQCSPWGVSISRTTDGKYFLSKIFSRTHKCGSKVITNVVDVKQWIENVIYDADQQIIEPYRQHSRSRISN